MTSKSKAKGGAWERDIANFLSNLYESPFMRVPNSGAFTGGQNATRKATMTEGQIRHMKGDIVPPDDWNNFNCEAKNYASFAFHRLLFKVPVPQLEEWLDQIKDAEDEGDVNMLFMKITRIGKFVGFEAHQPFTTHRHVDYTDKDGRDWKLTEFDSFFELNASAFRDAHK